MIEPEVTFPRCSGSVLEIARSRVDLPAPLAPSTAVTEPVGHVNVNIGQTLNGPAVTHSEIRHLEQHVAHPGAPEHRRHNGRAALTPQKLASAIEL